MDGQGFESFGLRPPAPPFPAYQALRGPIPGRPETHAERMARTDRQLERAKAERAAVAALDAASGDWRAVAHAYLGNQPVREVLELHRPGLLTEGVGRAIACNECSGADYYGDHGREWPCDTYLAIKGLL